MSNDGTTHAKAGRLFFGGTIYTADFDQKFVEAVGIRDDRIVFAGDLADAESICDEHTERTDLQGRMLLPGFIDGHCHPVMAAFFACGVTLSVEMTPDECLDEVRRFVEENPDEDSYFGIGYAEWNFDSRGPKRQLLDEICRDKPVLILGSSAHEGWANSRTLEIAEITKETPDPIPGFQYFHRDETGEPTGHIVELGALFRVVEKIDFFKKERVEMLLAAISEQYSRMGVTATCDMGVPAFGLETMLELVPRMIRDGSYRQRYFGCGMQIGEKKDIDPMLARLAELRETRDSNFFNIHFLKIINDGTIETRTAALSEPYEEDGSVVDPFLTEEELTKAGLKAAEAGLDINIHAIGDEAISGTLAMAKAVRAAGFKDTRITNSHCDLVKDEDLALFGKYNVIANTTCAWHYDNPDMEKIIGDRRNKVFRMRSIIDGGALMGQGSDFPIDEYGREPLKGIEMGCTRRLCDHPELHSLKPGEEKLSVEDGILSYTINNAYQMHRETELGSIKAGKLADLVILEENLFDIPVERIHKVRVCETIMNGQTRESRQTVVL